MVRAGLITTGMLCLAGLAGPAVGNLNWRLTGVFGYTVVFPVGCIGIARLFKNAATN